MSEIKGPDLTLTPKLCFFIQSSKSQTEPAEFILSDVTESLMRNNSLMRTGTLPACYFTVDGFTVNVKTW